MIKAIVFDFAGVLTPGIVAPYVKALSKTDPKYLQFTESSHKWDMGEMNIDEFYSTIATITGIPEDILKLTFYQKASYFPDMIDLIKKLKKNYKIVLFSNNFAYNVEQFFKYLGMRNLFDEVIVSSDHKMKKPEERFYKKLLEIVGLQENEIVFIDDTEENVDAGRKLGIQSFLFTDSTKLKKELQQIGIEC